MVAVIKTGHSIHRIVNYNENKVKEGVAEIISAVNYPIDPERLSLNQKLNRLLKQVALNENVTRNSVHISLNFDPSEKVSAEQLKQIAESYMQKIGFGEQPYLVYRHFDAGHPHIHVVSIKVRADGSRIDTQNIGRNQSEKARKEIEKDYGLVQAGSIKVNPYELKPAYVAKVHYGKSESRKAIANVLHAVINNYKYTSLPELNAVLAQYNVMAERGSEHSRLYQHHGLLYRILDKKGNSIGVPIKASSFHSKPTLKVLEEKFAANKILRIPHQNRIKNFIDLTLLKREHSSLQSLTKALEKQGINTVLRQNAEGIIYGITYVDHQTKCVFNGSALGKQYSANGILQRCAISHPGPAQNQELVGSARPQTNTLFRQTELESEGPKKGEFGLLETLMKPENASSSVPHHLTGENKKKRKKRISKHL